jgi:rubrerythrin
MEILEVVDRSIRAEQTAAAVYERLAEFFADDAALRELWQELAADEHGHAADLSEWRTRLAREPWDRRPIPRGFDRPFTNLEATLAAAVARADVATDPDDAFAIALELESSELDAIYSLLMRCSSLVRHSGGGQMGGHELGRHHARLLDAVRARSRDDVVRLRAELLETADVESRRSDRLALR